MLRRAVAVTVLQFVQPHRTQRYQGESNSAFRDLIMTPVNLNFNGITTRLRKAEADSSSYIWPGNTAPRHPDNLRPSGPRHSPESDPDLRAGGPGCRAPRSWCVREGEGPSARPCRCRRTDGTCAPRRRARPGSRTRCPGSGTPLQRRATTASVSIVLNEEWEFFATRWQVQAASRSLATFRRKISFEQWFPSNCRSRGRDKRTEWIKHDTFRKRPLHEHQFCRNMRRNTPAHFPALAVLKPRGFCENSASLSFYLLSCQQEDLSKLRWQKINF